MLPPAFGAERSQWRKLNHINPMLASGQRWPVNSSIDLGKDHFYRAQSFKIVSLRFYPLCVCATCPLFRSLWYRQGYLLQALLCVTVCSRVNTKSWPAYKRQKCWHQNIITCTEVCACISAHNFRFINHNPLNKCLIYCPVTQQLIILYGQCKTLMKIDIQVVLCGGRQLCSKQKKVWGRVWWLWLHQN